MSTVLKYLRMEASDLLTKVTLMCSMLVFVTTTSPDQLKRTRCIVCNSAVEKLVTQLSEISPTKKSDSTGYKITKSGDKYLAQVPLRVSEVFISDKIDSLCEDLNDYVFAYSKETGKQHLISLVGENGAMADTNKFDIEKDYQVNTMIPEHCNSIMSEYEDELIEVLKSEDKNPRKRFCQDVTGYCEDQGNRDEL